MPIDAIGQYGGQMHNSPDLQMSSWQRMNAAFRYLISENSN